MLTLKCGQLSPDIKIGNEAGSESLFHNYELHSLSLVTCESLQMDTSLILSLNVTKPDGFSYGGLSFLFIHLSITGNTFIITYVYIW